MMAPPAIWARVLFRTTFSTSAPLKPTLPAWPPDAPMSTLNTFVSALTHRLSARTRASSSIFAVVVSSKWKPSRVTPTAPFSSAPVPAPGLANASFHHFFVLFQLHGSIGLPMVLNGIGICKLVNGIFGLMIPLLSAATCKDGSATLPPRFTASLWLVATTDTA